MPNQPKRKPPRPPQPQRRTPEANAKRSAAQMTRTKLKQEILRMLEVALYENLQNEEFRRDMKPWYFVNFRVFAAELQKRGASTNPITEGQLAALVQESAEKYPAQLCELMGEKGRGLVLAALQRRESSPGDCADNVGEPREDIIP